jgi:hypothetical protein
MVLITYLRNGQERHIIFRYLDSNGGIIWEATPLQSGNYQFYFISDYRVLILQAEKSFIYVCIAFFSRHITS